MIKEKIKSSLLKAAEEKFGIRELDFPQLKIEEPPVRSFGDYATNIAFILAKKLNNSPEKIAREIAETLKQEFIEKVEVASPGFINFYLKNEVFISSLSEILQEKENYGRLNYGRNKKILLEFVSANPTGPLHVGHGRIAAIGDVLANCFSFAGYIVEREYYINDAEASKQIANLAKSLEIRYRQMLGENIHLGEESYQGDYLKKLAEKIVEKERDGYLKFSPEERLKIFREIALEEIFKLQKEELEKFGVKFDRFFSENQLYSSKEVEKVIKELQEKNYIYEKGKAVWFASSLLFDEKDRVIVRANGEPTYFAGDIAYHKNKYERGYDKMINIWGADHHGYIARLKSAISALGYDENKLDIIIVQMVNLTSSGEKVVMSKREGTMVTLSELLQEVGKDVARFFFISSGFKNTLDFDLELAKKETEENPVYYVQYAYARICSIFRKCEDIDIDREVNLSLLKTEEERNLIKKLLEFPEIILNIIRNYEIQKLTTYAKEVASCFHIFYHNCRVIDRENIELTKARLSLLKAVKIVLSNLFTIIGIEKKEVM